MNNGVIFLARGLAALSIVFMAALPAQAADHGGGGASSSAEPMQFVVNIGKTAETMHVLMAKIVLDYATPEASARFAKVKPKIMHQIILVLSGEDPKALMSSKGKRDVQLQIAGDLNKMLQEDAKTGVKDVFFTDFVIQ